MKLQKDIEISKTLLDQSRTLHRSKISDFDKLKKQFEKNELIIIGNKEILAEKDDRINELKEQITEVRKSYNHEQTVNVTTNVELEKIQLLYQEMSKNYEDINEKYHLVNKQRFNLEVQLKSQTDLNKEHKATTKESDKTILILRKQIEQDEYKILNLKRDLEARRLKTGNMQKQFNLKSNHANEKMIKMNEMMQTEIQSKTQWIDKFENEHKLSSELNAKLLTEQSKVSDKDLEIKVNF